MNGQNRPLIQGFVIALNEIDFQTVLDFSTRNICDPSIQQTLGTSWWTCENIKFTGTVDAVTARVGDTVTIQVGIQALPAIEPLEQIILSIQAWFCYPNTVPGGADASLVVSSMQDNQFASYDWSTSGIPLNEAPAVYNNMNYQQGNGFRWQPLTAWMAAASSC